MKKYKIWIILSVMTAALLIGCSSAESKTATEDNSKQETTEDQSSKTEKDAGSIEFEGTDMEGNKVSSDIFSESKLTMVNVWATYCNPCLSEMPELGELANEYEPGEFQIIGIISDVMEEDNEEMEELAAGLIEKTGADYTHLLLNESVYRALLTNVTAVPTSFFVDENGTVVDTVVGAMEKKAWEEKVNGLLEE